MHIAYDFRLHTEKKTVEELRRQRTNQQELGPVPAAAIEDNTYDYDYVYEVPGVAETDAQPVRQRSERVSRTPTQMKSTIR